MIKINPIKTIALATAITTGTVCSAQNRLQNAQKNLITTEFKKADINPQDFYISQDELNAYMQTNNINLHDYDGNNDNRLNIDEFASIGYQQKTAKQVEPQQVTNVKVQNVQTAQVPQYLNNTVNERISTIKPQTEIPMYIKRPAERSQNVSKSTQNNANDKKYSYEGWEIASQIENAKTDAELKRAVAKINKNNLKYVLKCCHTSSPTPGGLYNYIISLYMNKTIQWSISDNDYYYNHLYGVLHSILREQGAQVPVENGQRPWAAAKALNQMYANVKSCNNSGCNNSEGRKTGGVYYHWHYNPALYQAIYLLSKKRR